MKQEIICQDCGRICFQNNSGFWDCPACDVIAPRIAELEAQLEAARASESAALERVAELSERIIELEADCRLLSGEAEEHLKMLGC